MFRFPAVFSSEHLPVPTSLSFSMQFHLCLQTAYLQSIPQKTTRKHLLQLQRPKETSQWHNTDTALPAAASLPSYPRATNRRVNTRRLADWRPVSLLPVLPSSHRSVSTASCYLTNKTPIDVTGPANASKAILYVYDIFGYYPQSLQGADILSTSDKDHTYQVFMPDFFEGNPADISW